MKALIKMIAVGLCSPYSEPRRLSPTDTRTAPRLAKASWKPASDAEAWPRRRLRGAPSKIEGSCYEVYGVKDGKLSSCSTARKTSA